jgi:RNA polymerase sigma factor (sigma-70 family)
MGTGTMESIMDSNLSSSAKTATIDRATATTDETVLVNAAQSGSSIAFIELCQRHSARLLRRLHRITRNRHDAEDALQDAFLSAFRNLNRFENRCAFSSWLTAIAINAGLMTLRRKRGVAVPLDDQCEYLHDLSSSSVRHRGLNPEIQYERRERQILLSRAIRSLPPVLRSVTELRVVQDFSIDEIARNLRISHSAVKSRLARARTSLRQSIVGMGLHPEVESTVREPAMLIPPSQRSFEETEARRSA